MLGLDDAQRMVGAEDHSVAAVEPEGDARARAFALALHLDRAEGGATRPRCRASRPASPARGGRRARAAGWSRTGGPSPAAGSARPRDTRCRRGRCACPNGRNGPDSICRPAAAAAHRSASAARRGSDPAVRSADGSPASERVLGLLRARQLKAGVPHMTQDAHRHRDRRGQARRRSNRRGFAGGRLGGRRPCPSRRRRGPSRQRSRWSADLAEPDCAGRIFAAAEGLPPVRLLVNNAARFAWDGFGEFSAEEFDAHIGRQRPRAGFAHRRFARRARQAAMPGRQPSRCEAGRAQPRLSQLHLVEAGAGGADGACGACACAAMRSG